MRRYKKGCTIFFYHGVENKLVDPLLQEVHLPFSQFEKQVKYLMKNYKIISLDYLYDCIINGYKIDPSHVLLTFDDGYKNNIDVVEPFLRSMNTPFSVFISTRHIDTGKRFPTYYLRAAILYTEKEYISVPSINKYLDISSQDKRWLAISNMAAVLKSVPQQTVDLMVSDLVKLLPDDRWVEMNNLFMSDEPMNWDDIKKLHKSGVIIGSHCHDHAILHDHQSGSEINYQLKTSKELIEKHLGECKYFAYPNGSMKKISLEAMLGVKENRYLLGFSIVPGEIETPVNTFLLPRILAVTDFDEFKFHLSSCSFYNKKYIEWSYSFSST